jgi:hypothetical protein
MQNTISKNKTYYPYKIVCVTNSFENRNTESIKKIHNFCNENKLACHTRKYNLNDYNEDYEIKKLPAFHIYFKNHNINTIYYDNHPIPKIKKELDIFEKKEKIIKLNNLDKNKEWNKFLFDLIRKKH